MLGLVWKKWRQLDCAARVAAWRLGASDHQARVELAAQKARGRALQATLSKDLRQERKFRSIASMGRVLQQWGLRGLLRVWLRLGANLAGDRALRLMEESEHVSYLFAQEVRPSLSPSQEGWREGLGSKGERCR